MRTIAIDAMGGENAPEAIIEAVLKAKGEMPDTKFLLFGDKEQIELAEFVDSMDKKGAKTVVNIYGRGVISHGACF